MSQGLISVANVREAGIAALVAAGMPDCAAVAVMEHLIAAETYDRASHGVNIRLPMVLQQLADGKYRELPVVSQDTGTTLRMDARGTLGCVAGRMAVDILVERLDSQPMLAVGIHNCGHTGMLGYYARRAAARGCILLAFGHCCPLMAPYGGTQALLGTNPIAFGFPGEPPIVVDVGTAEVGYGKVRVAESAGHALPEGAALDRLGQPTTDPKAVLDGGCVLPFGGHRGGALAIAIQLLAGALTGASPIPSPGTDYGLLMIGLRRDTFATAESYDEAVRRFAEVYTAIPAQAGSTCRLPGQRGASLSTEIALDSALADRLGL